MSEPKSIKKLSLLFFCILVAGIWSINSLRPHQNTIPTLDIWMLDVGQGESVLVREPGGKKLLFDGGPTDAVLSELGSILPPWDKTIDLVVLSHNHSDHIRGLISVLQRYTVKEIWISGAIHTTEEYRTFLEELKTHNLKPTISYFDSKKCTTICPTQTQFGEANLQVYHPLEDSTGIRPTDQHDATVMVKVSYSNSSLLLTGDIDEGHEQDIIRTCRPPICSLRATFLQIPHHGSATGLSPDFLKAVSPKVALIPVGADNKFNHPRQVILDRLDQAKIPTYRTDTQGRIHIAATSQNYSLSTGH